MAFVAALFGVAVVALGCCGLLSAFGIAHHVRDARSGRAALDETTRTRRRYDRQAGLYDFWEAPLELLALRRLRQRLWGEADTRSVLEVGVGTGKNLPYHPESARSVAVDISPRMLRKAVARAQRLGRDVDLVLADAQHLPFREGAFGAAAATFVFCSVPDPLLGLQEVRRVVRKEGVVHLLEHVRARNPVAGRIMDLMNPLCVRVTGANINRDTVGNVAKAGLAVDSVESRGFGIVKLIRASRAQPSRDKEQEALSREAISDVARG